MTTESVESRLSVLIASVNGSPMIEECLEALSRQTAIARLEIVIADATDEATRAVISRSCPAAKILVFPRGTTIPRLRAAAFDASTGEIVAVTEDHCLPEPAWAERMLAAHDGRWDAVGGAVENGAVTRVVDWAVFFCEYARYLSPVPRGEWHDIPGINCSYRREVLARHRGLLENGFWEGIVHPVLLSEGARFQSAPEIVVVHKKRFGFGYFVSQRYHYSRYYGAARAAGRGWASRLGIAAATVALPVLLAARSGAAVFGKRRQRGRYLIAFPTLASFYVVWAVGEITGTLFGPGDSLARVE